MNNPRHMSMLAALMIAAGVAFAPAGASAQTVDQMSVEQLLQTQQRLEAEIAAGVRQGRKRFLRQIQGELRRREAEANQNPQPQQQQAQPQQNQQQQQQAQPQPQQNQQRQRTQSQQQQPQQAQPQQGDNNDGNVNRQARRYLRGGDNVRNMNDNELRSTVRDGRELLQRGDLRGNLQRQVRDRVQAARGEMERRNQSAQQPQPQPQQQQRQQAGSSLDGEARRLLNDNRPASALGDEQLRDRLGEARRIMGSGDLDRRLFRQIRRMAQQDRTELRGRVSGRDVKRVERREDRQDARQLLDENRSARDLNDRQLQARITSARDLLASNTVRAGQKERIEDLLREARREKRRRLMAGRAERRERLRSNRGNPRIVIQIPSVRFGPDREDIDAAEADDELLQRQLVAPPRRRIQRKYSRQDFRTGRPADRRSMPAIEVDTIRFGFNESFVREEEIPQLERIGEIIERIIAGNPDEVFLIEGHTDAVGSDSYNQGLSAKRADAVRDAMLQFFNIDASNIETVGYGEEFLKIDTQEEEPENRRVTIRRITPLLSNAN